MLLRVRACLGHLVIWAAVVVTAAICHGFRAVQSAGGKNCEIVRLRIRNTTQWMMVIYCIRLTKMEYTNWSRRYWLTSFCFVEHCWTLSLSCTLLNTVLTMNHIIQVCFYLAQQLDSDNIWEFTNSLKPMLSISKLCDFHQTTTCLAQVFPVIKDYT